jgi:hypothetical protein
MTRVQWTFYLVCGLLLGTGIVTVRLSSPWDEILLLASAAYLAVAVTSNRARIAAAIRGWHFRW